MVGLVDLGLTTPNPIRRSRRKKVIERWAKKSPWTWSCAEELGLVSSTPHPPSKVPVEVNKDRILEDYDAVVVIDPFGQIPPYEIQHSSNGKIYDDNSVEENGDYEDELVVNAEDKNSCRFSSPRSDSNNDSEISSEVLMELDSCEDNMGIQTRDQPQVIASHPGTSDDNDLIDINIDGIHISDIDITEISIADSSVITSNITNSNNIENSDDIRDSQELQNSSIVYEETKVQKKTRGCKSKIKIDETTKSSSSLSNNVNFSESKDTVEKVKKDEKEDSKNEYFQRRTRNPLDFVNKTYKGINKIELEQKIYEETLLRCNSGERRVTRRIVKETTGENEEVEGGKKEQTTKKNEAVVTRKYYKGQIVWGFCQGWWPALIIEPEDAGMVITEPGMLWVFWIGENQITQLTAQTQIRPFSNNLESRLINQLNLQKPTSSKYKACVAVIELLRMKFSFTLTQPFSKWVTKHFLNMKNLDDIRYFPYPEKMNKKLDELKEINAPKTAKYLLDKEKEDEQSSSEDASESEDPGTETVKDATKEGYVPLIEQKIGTFVWSKMIGHNWWPAVIVDFKDSGMREPKFGTQWIMWYGDYMLSEVNHGLLWSFVYGLDKLKECIEKSKKPMYVEAVLQASKDYFARQGLQTDKWTIKNIFEWLSKIDNDDTVSVSSDLAFETEKYSKIIWKKLCFRKITCTISGPREDDIKDSDALRKVKKGKLNINDLCLICLETDIEDPQEHPYFTGLMCKECSEDYIPTIFSYGDDGKCYFCSFCGGSGYVVMCSIPDCPLVYCTACLKYLISPEYYKDIMAQDPWNCFFCENNSKQMSGGLVKPRPDWEARSKSLFNSPHNDIVSPILNPDGSKRKVRVLSLFDGIATGLVALKKLGIEIEVYYASEIDADALSVSHMNFPHEITQLGDVRNISDQKIKEIAPIDLLIGGSPCNDLSIANPQRKGLDDPTGTGILFYEYLRIKKTLEKVNKGHYFFWFFENVASMPAKYRNKISELFGQEPDVIDSAQFSAQHRPRLYWNNLPMGLASFTSPDLQEMLDPYCNRSALVKKIRTVTTCSNSLREGKRHSLKPIIMNGVYDVLRVSELERVFGFPRHYTDANLSLTKRLKLIGKAWSVHTICAMMQSLCNYFKSI